MMGGPPEAGCVGPLRVMIGLNVLVWGAGSGVGAVALQMAHRAGARVLAVVRRDEQLPSVRAMGAAEACLIAEACSEAPEGRSRWTLKLLADRLVALEVVESISPETVRQMLKKTTSSVG